MKVSELKKICSQPDLVEVWDVTSADPKGKRHIEKQPFQLRDFIAATGIDKIREGYIQKQEKLKPKQHEKMMHPMMRFSSTKTKPNPTAHGDIYYEGKEFEVELTREMKLGMQISQLLKEASASYGYHPGGWGKPPVGEYWDVFGVQQQYNQEEELIGNTKHWEANIQSVGVETSDVIDLCKRPRTEPDKYLYQVLEKKEERIALGTLLGTPHVYVIGGSGTPEKTAGKGVDYLLKRRKSDGVDVTLQPDELELMDDALPAKYEEVREEKLRSLRVDFSDMVAEYEKNRNTKRQEKQGKLKRNHFSNSEEQQKMFGRHFDIEDELVSHISRKSIDELRDNYRDDLSSEEWKLVKKLKILFKIYNNNFRTLTYRRST
ncbi:hypothetical protein RHSIM_Rhsim02G0211400 [Rhododendron simsii]|uniref:DUF382 domain-containing protein n=1 Tax=Rhododendron simsii TaxID=118357 RepID=A0A834H937_RHOSS|nr:hypothetical protein RHSIM_Rhsim02G0211400 [Rhododendron simsii]